MATSSTSTDHPRTSEHQQSPLVAYRWPVALIVCCLLLIAAVFCGLKYFMPHLPPLTITTIKKRFSTEIPVWKAVVGGNLEVGTGEATEDFKKSDKRYAGFGWIYLGETTSEIKVPVTYRYHLALAGNWRLDQSGNVCVVTVPKLEPSLPVAFDSARMEKYSGNGWSRFDKTDQLDQLEKEITPTLEEYAKDEKRVDAARQKFRPIVANFVREWLLKEDQWRADRFTSVIVIFEDEQSQAPAGAPVIATPKP